MKRITIFFLLLAAGTAAQAALQNDSLPSKANDLKIAADDPEIQEIDRVLMASYLNHFCYSSDQTILNAYGYSPEQVPTFAPDITAARMKAIDKDTPFDLVYNNTVQGFIDLYAVRREISQPKFLVSLSFISQCSKKRWRNMGFQWR